MEHNDSSLREILAGCTTQQLDEMLHAELSNDPADEATVRMIMGVLEDREADHPVDVNDDVAKAWEKYRAGQDSERRQSFSKHIIRWNWMVKAASVILVLGIAVSVLSQEVNAETLLDKIARWSESIFELFSPGYQNDNEVEYVFKTDHPGLQQVYDAVSELGVTEPVVPTWLPEELQLIEIDTKNVSKDRGIVAAFESASYFVVFRMDISSGTSPSEYHKNEANVKKYEKGGVTHYLMENSDNCTIVWSRSNIECALSMNCQEDTILQILESIYGLEDG